MSGIANLIMISVCSPLYLCHMFQCCSRECVTYVSFVLNLYLGFKKHDTLYSETCIKASLIACNKAALLRYHSYLIFILMNFVSLANFRKRY